MRLSLLFFLFLSCSLSVSAQNTFSRIFDLGLPNVIFTGVDIVDDEILISGIVRDTINGYRLTHGLVRTDLQGNLITSTILRQPGINLQPWLKSTSYEDKIFHVGSSVDSINKGLIQCFDTAGNYLWTVREPSPIDSSSFFIYTDVCVINDRIFALGHHSLTSSSNGALLVISEYNLSGEFINFFTLNTNGKRDLSYTIKVINDETLLIGSRYDNFHQAQINLKVHSRLWLTDLDGSLQASWISPAEELQIGALDIALSPDGGYIVAGAKGEEIRINSGNSTIYWDCMIYKLDQNFNKVWETLFRHSLPVSTHRFNRIIPVADGSGYVASGRSTAYFGGDDIEVENIGDRGGIVAKVSPEGDSLWSRIIIHPDHPNFEEDDMLYDLKELPGSGFVLVGESGHYLAPPTQQGWLLRLDEYGCLVPGCQLVSSVEEQSEEAHLSVLLYPNPAQNILNVFVPEARPGTGQRTLQVANTAGQVLKTIQLHSLAATYLLEIAPWPAGTYYLRVSDAAGEVLATEAFLKQ
jgi:hypothetical protein